MELQPGAQAIEDCTEAVRKRLHAFLQEMPNESPAPQPGAKQSFAWQPPAEAKAIESILDELFQEVLPSSVHVNHPGFMAYVPTTSLWSGGLAKWMDATLNRYSTVRAGGLGPADMEASVVRWFCDWMGYDERAGGILTSGGSLANFTAFVAAREAAGVGDLRTLRWYASAQTHHTNHRAAHMAGLQANCFVPVAADARGRLDLDALREAIAADRKAGHIPFLVVANGGTTDTGAVDDLASIRSIIDAGWMHVDAAYGGFFVLTPDGKQRLAGIALADSITLDPHKGLGMPFGIGALVVQDQQRLVSAFAMRGAYMPEMGDRPDTADMSPELTRNWRALTVWFTVMLHGLDAFRAALQSSLDLARAAADRLQAIDGVELHGEPELSAFAFRAALPGASDEAREAANKQLLDAIHAGGKVFLSSTRLEDEYWIRVCLLHAGTTMEHIDALVGSVAAAVPSL